VQPGDEEQTSADGEQNQAQPCDEEDTDKDTETTEDDNRKPSATEQAAAANVTQSTLELAQLIASTSGNTTQFTSNLPSRSHQLLEI
jgi:hypothetical protein